jgi:hypothetical protein
MEQANSQEIARALMCLYEESCQTPFPYEDSRKLLREEKGQYEGLIPSLDFYFSTIAGYCSWGKRILKWNEEKIKEAKDLLGKSFFEKYPQYKPLEQMVTEANTPALYKELVAYETMRLNLLRLLSLLASQP